MKTILNALWQLILFVLAAATMFGVRWFVRYGDFNSPTGEWFIIIIIAGFVALIFISYLRSTLAANAVASRVPTDISDELRMPTQGAKTLIKQIEKIGFQRLGESSVEINGNEGVTWFLVNSGCNIVVEVVDPGIPMCQFSTVFQDGAVIETSYPKGETVNKHNYYSRRNSKDVQAAYKQHITEAKKLVEKHGSPIAMKSMKALIEWEVVYRDLYGRHKIGKFAQNQLAAGIVGMVILGISIYVLRMR